MASLLGELCRQFQVVRCCLWLVARFDIITQTHRHTDAQTHRHTDAQTHRHTDAAHQTEHLNTHWVTRLEWNVNICWFGHAKLEQIIHASAQATKRDHHRNSHVILDGDGKSINWVKGTLFNWVKGTLLKFCAPQRAGHQAGAKKTHTQSNIVPGINHYHKNHTQASHTTHQATQAATIAAHTINRLPISIVCIPCNLPHTQVKR